MVDNCSREETARSIKFHSFSLVVTPFAFVRALAFVERILRHMRHWQELGGEPVSERVSERIHVHVLMASSIALKTNESKIAYTSEWNTVTQSWNAI